MSKEDSRIKIDWEQQGRIMPHHPNWVPHSYVLNHPDDQFGVVVVLALMNELLDMIPPPLRGVTCDWKEGEITAHCYFDGQISEDHISLMDNLQFHLEMGFEGVSVNVKCIRKDEPENLNQYTIKEWVYRRRKPYYENGGDRSLMNPPF